MNLQEKRDYVLNNINKIPSDILEMYQFNFSCVLTKNSTGMEKNNPLSMEKVVSIIKGHPVVCDEMIKRNIYNHYKAYQFMQDYLKNKSDDELITEDFIKDLHEIILKNISNVGGLYRNINIRINGSDHIPCDHIKVYDRMKKYVYELNHSNLSDLELVTYAHLQLAKIHPFLDGNGRLARLILNYFLIIKNYMPISISSKRRIEYFGLLEEFKVNKNPLPFQNFLVELLNLEYDRFIETLNEYV